MDGWCVGYSRRRTYSRLETKEEEAAAAAPWRQCRTNNSTWTHHRTPTISEHSPTEIPNTYHAHNPYHSTTPTFLPPNSLTTSTPKPCSLQTNPSPMTSPPPSLPTPPSWSSSSCPTPETARALAARASATSTARQVWRWIHAKQQGLTIRMWWVQDDKKAWVNGGCWMRMVRRFRFSKWVSCRCVEKWISGGMASSSSRWLATDSKLKSLYIQNGCMGWV